ncbi:MAG: cytochrome c biogenesis protein ResB [Burkholderiales bacterium]|nr:cytochrome c biogenesis protein ResB [Phycisphaerae bacterium]
MIVRILETLLQRTLRNVWFGIALLVLIATYIAIGSGLPGVREYFELDEVAFFNAWPFRVLMILLVATLVTVTLERIPFTPTRWGAWIVHVGIVSLVFGGFWHYRYKVEGSTLILQNQTVNHYFDRWERALYVQVPGQMARAPLPGFPRFNAYDAALGNGSALNKFAGLNPVTSGASPQSAGEMAGVKDLRFAVVGYWPYADIRQRLVDRAGGGVGYSLVGPPHPGEDPHDLMLLAGALRYSRTSLHEIELEHRALADPAELSAVAVAASRFHTLNVKLPGFEQSLVLDVGREYRLGDTGYAIVVESFDPRWQTMDKKIVPLLTLMVQTPTTKFRRQVISGSDKPTDWILAGNAGSEGAGPLGKRQTELLDNALITNYTFDDSKKLQPREGTIQYTFFSIAGTMRTTIIAAGPNVPTAVQMLDGSAATITLQSPPPASEVMMAVASGQPLPPAEQVAVEMVRKESAAVEEYVEEVPKIQRNKDDGQAGRKQVVKVRATDGAGWHEDVFVPFNEQILLMPWRGGLVSVPGVTAPVQMQLGNNYRLLPASIRLDKFEADAYGGVDIASAPMMRDFRSTITITDPRSGERVTDTVYLNNPVFYQGGDWIFFQSGWDNQQQRFTILGIGNRPGVRIMAMGCGLIVLGIFYAFYIKPIIIKANKQRALAKAGKAAQA